MKSFILIGLTFIFLGFISCNGASDQKDLITEDADTVLTDTVLIDTSDTLAIDTLQVDSAGYIDEEAALTTQIEQKYGEQWDFCDCVVKNDSVNAAILETEDDAAIDAILNRMEVIDQHCKELLTMPNTTPEERAKHERKVNKCLKAAK